MKGALIVGTGIMLIWMILIQVGLLPKYTVTCSDGHHVYIGKVSDVNAVAAKICDATK